MYSAGACADSCGSPVASGEFAFVGDYCYYDCYVPIGTCIAYNGADGYYQWSYDAKMDFASCWAISNYDFNIGWFYFNAGPTATYEISLKYQTVAAQQTCSMLLSYGPAPLVVQTCADCRSTCTALNDFEVYNDCTSYTCGGTTGTPF